jgi:urease accessory protein
MGVIRGGIMMRAFTARTLVIVGAAFAAPVAMAHTGHGVAGAASGFAHPFAGLDHLLALFAIGAWAAQQEGRARWSVPLAFIAAMAVGALAGVSGFALPSVEPMIAASVVALGLAVAAGLRTPLYAGVGVAALFAVFHGHAHGTEVAHAPLAAYLGGMLLATALLHGAGFATGLAIRATALRWTGAAVAAGGVGLMLAGA